MGLTVKIGDYCSGRLTARAKDLGNTLLGQRSKLVSKVPRNPSDTVQMNRSLLPLLLSCVFGLSIRETRAQQAEPRVARLEMKLMLGKEVLDVISKGDLLTVLNERENSYVIQTFNGQKGAVAKVNAVSLRDAVPIYDELVAEMPEEGRLYTLRASAEWAAGNAEKALLDYDKAIELGYDEAHAFSSRGLFHAAMRHPELAIQDYTMAISINPKDEVPLINRAAVHMAEGNHQLALDDYTTALGLRPENPVLYTQRAVALKLLGRLEQAVQDYDQALRWSEKDVSAWMGRGFLHFQLEHHQAAIDDFSQAIELAPQTAVAYNNRGYNYQILGRHRQALADFRKAVELAPKYLLALHNKAWLLASCDDPTLRDPATAITTATTICEMSDYKDVSDLTLLAAAHAAADEFETAIGWQEKAIELSQGEQLATSRKILQLYEDGQPFDPRLLDEQAERPPSPRTTRPSR